MKVRCSQCGGEARVSIRPTGNQFGAWAIVAAFLLGLIALCVFLPAYGLTMVAFWGLGALWQWVVAWWNDMHIEDRYGRRLMTSSEQEQHNAYKKHKAEQDRADEVRAALTQDPSRVTVHCPRCGVIQ